MKQLPIETQIDPIVDYFSEADGLYNLEAWFLTFIIVLTTLVLDGFIFWIFYVLFKINS